MRLELAIMKTVLPAILLVAAASSLANAAQNITCNDIRIPVPAKLGDLPSIDFEYPSQVSVFSFRGGNLLMIAHDRDDPSRPRLVISAQLNKATRTYTGQIIRDDGGNERQLINGPVSCAVK